MIRVFNRVNVTTQLVKSLAYHYESGAVISVLRVQ